LLHLEALVNFEKHVLNFFGLFVKLTEIIRVNGVGSLDRLVTLHVVADLEGDEAVGELALSGDAVVLSELHLEENQHVAQMLVGLLVVNVVDLHAGVFVHLVEVVFENEFTPDLNDLAKECLSLLKLVFFLEQFAHVEIAGAHAV